jgi:hypothetical protein
MTAPTTAPTKKSQTIPLLSDAWCCFFLAAGLLFALYKLMEAYAPQLVLPGDFLYCPAFFVLLLLIFNRRLTLMSVCMASLMIVLFLITSHSTWLNVDFIRWWSSGFPSVSKDIANNYYLYYFMAMRWLLAAVVCISLWLLIRLRTPFWLMLIGCPALVAFQAYLTIRGFSVSIYLLAAGLAPLAAASTVKRVSPARGRAAAYALPLIILVLGATFLALPADTSGWRWQPLGDKVEEWREQARVLYWNWLTRKEPLPALDLSDEYYFHLGGPISPGNERMLLVETNEPMLLKGSVYDYYTGHSWTKHSVYYYELVEQEAALLGFITADLKSYPVPFTSEITEDELDQILGSFPQRGSDHPLDSLVRPYTAEITLLHPQEPRLFYGGRPQSFSTDYEIEPFFEQNEAELKAGQPLYNGYRYELNGLTLDRTQKGFADAMAKAELWEGDMEYELYANMGVYQHLPLSLSLDQGFMASYHLAKDIVEEGLAEGETRSHYEQAVKLESWFKDPKNCTYSLTPATPSENRDFAMFFLESREGYCTYYATAMVVMARMLNMRARYVTGYSLRPLREDNHYEATQATAHAWAEIYFDGVGWLPFDPTGFSDYTEVRVTPGIGTNPQPGDPHDRRGNDNTPATDDIPPADYRNLRLAVLILAVAALAAIILMLRRALTAFRLPRLQARFAPGAVLDIYYSNLLAQLDMLGWPRRPAETVTAFLRRIGNYHHLQQKRQLQQLATAVCDWRYGGLAPAEDSLLNAASLHEHFEAQLRWELKRGRAYLIRYYAFRLRHRPKATNNFYSTSLKWVAQRLQ